MPRRSPLVLAGALALALTACSLDDVTRFLLEDPPPHPGRESVTGAHLVYDRDKEGEWSAERTYSKEQEEQLEAYREYRRNRADN